MVERSQKEVWRLTPWLMVVLLLGNFVLMAWDAKTESQQRVIRVWGQAIADFVQSPVTSVSSGVSNYFQSFSNLRGAATENEQLKLRVQELEVELQGKESFAAENERLKLLLNLKEESKYPILTAKVIGRDPSGWFNTSIINRGSVDGVKLNMPVVTNGGLVGRIMAVGPLTSQVMLLTDDKSGIAGIAGELGNSNALGVIRGTSEKELVEMRYVPGSIPVEVGETVFTTGQDGIYPAGLKIGEVVSVESGSATTTHSILVKPGGALNSMQEVAVLLYEAPPAPKFEQALPNAAKDEKGKGKKKQ
ncbi:MAG TPA: rod shape-determining protein MreC [Pyrinomonadaceae bacterium]|nr:rod shape-determining protein MreC [Pyrinomonadaceae bacterium]